MNNPYPGLRPFKYEESYLFFGRDGQSEDLLKKLNKSHFVGVVGTSGSGKSSLVRAGLLPLLNSGFMPNTGSDWRVAVFRPGDDPIHNLAHALVQPGYSEEGQSDDPLKVGIAETILRRSAIGLPDYVSSEDFGEDENLLVVVDQFEELFRFERESGLDKPDEEAAAFVKLLLEAAKDKSGK
ncbi:MAG: hypothetical protein HKN33_07865, partial [Pyrinomonadaceae bacterium]|nr:hypothetical protein [Pyrinomonadaceae bacterium]